MMEAIILAGGLGTRLRAVVPELPKPMAPIDGRPFLAFVLDALVAVGFETVVLAVGHKGEAIREHFGSVYRSLTLRYSVETEPLGTGGAIRFALEQTQAPQVFVLNGDTYLDLDYQAMLGAHLREGANLSVAVQGVPDTGRYGALDIEDGRIKGFFEKGRAGAGMINAGVYLLARNLLDRYRLPSVFSFEADFLMPHVREISPLAFEARGVFIDIGVPDDYLRAQELLGSTLAPHGITGGAR